MITYPFAKINLGLKVTAKRDDGFHDIETVFYPVEKLSDILEVVESKEMDFKVTGIPIGDAKENIVLKAYKLLKDKYFLPPVKILLEKNIPTGAGLGGGSSDGTHMLMLLNDLFNLCLSDEQLAGYALQLGSDCPFFIHGKPAFALGRGEILNDINVSLSGFQLIIVKPPVHISTAEAYKGITPKGSRLSLKRVIVFPVARWNVSIQNQFESHIFESHPEIKVIKDSLYRQGATFALMSGSGSAVYGLFRQGKRNIKQLFPADYQIFEATL